MSLLLHAKQRAVGVGWTMTPGKQFLLQKKKLPSQVENEPHKADERGLQQTTVQPLRH